MANATLEEFNAAIENRANGIAPEAVALIKPVAKRANDLFGSVVGTTLMTVASDYPFAKETQAFVNGNATLLETLATVEDPEPDPEP